MNKNSTDKMIVWTLEKIKTHKTIIIVIYLHKITVNWSYSTNHVNGEAEVYYGLSVIMININILINFGLWITLPAASTGRQTKIIASQLPYTFI